MEKLRSIYGMYRHFLWKTFCLGKTAAMYVIDREIRITRDRGIWRMKKGIWMLPTFHPAALLLDESKKRDAWHDMQSLRDKIKELGLDEE